MLFNVIFGMRQVLRQAPPIMVPLLGRTLEMPVGVGLCPVATLQYGSTTSYQVSYNIPQLLS